jgi:UDP-glucose 4-epimerase
MKLLITGGAGFIGTNLIAHLCDAGQYDVTVLDNESAGRREHVAKFNVRFVKGDICDLSALNNSMRGQDAVVHLAADTRVMDSIENPQHNFNNNVVGTFNVLMAARACGIARVVSASTGGAILGEAVSPVHEELAPRPISPYGASKLAAEGYVNAFAASYGMKNSSLRFSNIYGPRSYHKGSVVAHFFKNILAGIPLTVYGDGSQVRDYLFVRDLVEGIRQAIESDATGVFQLGSQRPTSLNDLIKAIKEATGRDIDVQYNEFRPGEIHTTWCDISKARSAFGFAPDTPLETGLKSTWLWYLDQEERR